MSVSGFSITEYSIIYYCNNNNNNLSIIIIIDYIFILEMFCLFLPYLVSFNACV